MEIDQCSKISLDVTRVKLSLVPMLPAVFDALVRVQVLAVTLRADQSAALKTMLKRHIVCLSSVAVLGTTQTSIWLKNYCPAIELYRLTVDLEQPLIQTETGSRLENENQDMAWTHWFSELAQGVQLKCLRLDKGWREKETLDRKKIAGASVVADR